VRAAVIIGVALITFTFILLPVRGVGISMEPTIEQGDLIFVNLLAYRFRDPRRGDIVAVRIAGRSLVYVKRLIGLPGEEFELREGVLRINGESIEEPYVTKRVPWNIGPVTLGADQYFVVGDNRSMRVDEHEMGIAPRARLIGPKLF
jgi:signal peptidase I